MEEFRIYELSLEADNLVHNWCFIHTNQTLDFETIVAELYDKHVQTNSNYLYIFEKIREDLYQKGFKVVKDNSMQLQFILDNYIRNNIIQLIKI